MLSSVNSNGHSEALNTTESWDVFLSRDAEEQTKGTDEKSATLGAVFL